MREKEHQLLHIRLPKIWIKMMDEDAARQFITRTQWIKNALKAHCLRTPKGQ